MSGAPYRKGRSGPGRGAIVTVGAAWGTIQFLLLALASNATPGLSGTSEIWIGTFAYSLVFGALAFSSVRWPQIALVAAGANVALILVGLGMTSGRPRPYDGVVTLDLRALIESGTSSAFVAAGLGVLVAAALASLWQRRSS